MSIRQVCARQVDLAEPRESVQVAAARMNARNVGSLVVVNEQTRPVGIVTDRDLTVKVVAQGLDPFTTFVGDVMTICPQAVSDDASIEEALTAMRAGPFRRLPVVDQSGQLVGVVSVDDVLELLAEEFCQIGLLLRRESPAMLARI